MHWECQNLQHAGTTGLVDVPPTLKQTFSETHFDYESKTGSSYIHNTQYSLTVENYSDIQKFKIILTKACMHACAQHTTSTVPEHYRLLQCFTFGCTMLAKSSFLFTHSEWAKFWTSTKYSVANYEYFQRPCVTLHNFVSCILGIVF